MLNIAKYNIKSNDLPINKEIKVNQLMVIGPNGEKMGVKSLQDALTIASFAGLDLVLMNKGSDQPVGKIMDYNKYKYEKNKKTKDALKKQRESNKEMKEYQLSVKIDIHDFDTRKKHAQEYLIKGHKIKVTIRFRGRELEHIDVGRDVMLKFAEGLSDYCTIESMPSMEGKTRTMTMVLAPKKEI